MGRVLTGFLLLWTCMVATSVATDWGFIYGSGIDNATFLETQPRWFDLDSASALRLNEVGCYATKANTTWTLHIDSLATRGIRVGAGNSPDHWVLPDSERGYIIKYLHRGQQDQCRYNVWQAEDTTKWNGLYGLTHTTGSQTSDGWVLTTGDDSGVVQSGPAVISNGGSVASPRYWIVQYRLKFDTTTALSDSTPVVRLFGTHGATNVNCGEGNCGLVPDPFYDTTLTVADLKVGGQLAQWTIVERLIRFVRVPQEVCATCTYAGEYNVNINFNIEWLGRGTLEIDWTRCLDQTNGYVLVQSPDSTRRVQIENLASNFADKEVISWFGDESGYMEPSKIDAYIFVDSLVKHATDSKAFSVADVQLDYIGADTIAESRFNFHMYRMLRDDGLRYLFPWSLPFNDSDANKFNVDYVNANWYDLIASRMSQHIMPWVDSVPGFRVVPAVQVWSWVPDPSLDPSPTMNDVVCQSFLYLAHGAKGITFARYDGGQQSDLNYRWGLTYDYGGQRVYSKRHEALRRRVSPLLMPANPSDTSGWGRLLVQLDWRGAGKADTLRDQGNQGLAWNLIKAFSSSVEPGATPYVEAGFFADSARTEDYLMLVNRRTVPTTIGPQWVHVTLNTTKFQTPDQTHYYLIDLNPADTLPGADTILAGPINDEIAFADSIPAGGVKFYKIAAAPSRIAGSSYPRKWWGEIDAGDWLQIPSGCTLSLAPPLIFKMDADSIPSGFYVGGKLVARGTADSVIVFDRQKDGVYGIWGGLQVAANSAVCSLEYCSIRNAERAVELGAQVTAILDHVTVEASGDPACVSSCGGARLELNFCDIEGGIQTDSGSVVVTHSAIHDAAIGLDLGVPSGTSDTALISYSTIRDCSDFGILTEGRPVRAIGCDLAANAVGLRAFNAPIRLDSITVDTCGFGVVVDSNAVLGGATLSVDVTSIGLVFDQGWGSFDGYYVLQADTGMIADPGSGHTITMGNASIISSSTLKGVAAHSGELIIRNSTIVADSYTGIDAYTGDALVRLDSSFVEGNATSSAAISIGPDARIVASNTEVAYSYIGMEIKGSGADSVSRCRLRKNGYYGLWFSDGDSADYTYGNYIVGDSTHSPSIGTGYYAYRQSVKSTSDTVDGHYGCLFKYFGVGSSSATVNGLVAIGASPDGVGLSLQGASSDTAIVHGSEVNEDFNSLHAFLYGLNVDVEESEFISTGNPQSSAYYGILDQGYTTGRVACTKILDQVYGCIGRSAGSAIDYGNASLSTGGNSVYVTDSAGYAAAKYFWNFGYDTVRAEDNWWGQASPPAARFAGPIDRTPDGTTAPLCSAHEGKLAADVDAALLPYDYMLEQNYPNPFNPTTSIRFVLPAEQQVSLELFNVLGQRVRRFNLGLTPAGQHSVFWNGRDEAGRPVGSGLYFYRLSTPEFISTRRMLLLK